MKECPKCLALKEVFNPFENDMVTCPLCNGTGEATLAQIDKYDPIDDEFSVDDYLNE